jgi:hypothetical protein
MSSSSIGKHASTSGASDQPPVPELSFAERARTLVHISRTGSLSTLSFWSRWCNKHAWKPDVPWLNQ